MFSWRDRARVRLYMRAACLVALALNLPPVKLLLSPRWPHNCAPSRHATVRGAHR